MSFDLSLFSPCGEPFHLDGGLTVVPACPKLDQRQRFTLKVIHCPSQERKLAIENELSLEMMCSSHVGKIRGKLYQERQSLLTKQAYYYVLQEDIGRPMLACKRLQVAEVKTLIWQMLEALQNLEELRLFHGAISKQSVFYNGASFFLTNFSRARNYIGKQSVISIENEAVSLSYADCDILQALVQGAETQLDNNHFKLDLWFLGKLVVELLCDKPLPFITGWDTLPALLKDCTEITQLKEEGILLFLQNCFKSQFQRPKASGLLELLKANGYQQDIIESRSFIQLSDQRGYRLTQKKFTDMNLEDLRLSIQSSRAYEPSFFPERLDAALEAAVPLSKLLRLQKVEVIGQKSQRLTLCRVGELKAVFCCKLYSGLSQEEVAKLVALYESIDQKLAVTAEFYSVTRKNERSCDLALYYQHRKFSLMEWVAQNRPAKARIVMAETLGKALLGLHRLGHVHGNLKLTNVLFDKESELFFADFEPPVTRKGVKGYPPEQYQGQLPSQSSDVWMAGSMFAALFDQKLLQFTSQYYRGYQELDLTRLPHWSGGLVQRMMAASPFDRSTIEDALSGIRAIRRSLPPMKDGARKKEEKKRVRNKFLSAEKKKPKQSEEKPPSFQVMGKGMRQR